MFYVVLTGFFVYFNLVTSAREITKVDKMPSKPEQVDCLVALKIKFEDSRKSLMWSMDRRRPVIMRHSKQVCV